MSDSTDEAADGGADPCGPLVVINAHQGRPRPDARVAELQAAVTAMQATLDTVVAAMNASNDTLFDVVRLLRSLNRKESAQMVKLADFHAEMQAQRTVTEGVLTMVDGLATQLQQALDNGSDEELRAVLAEMQTNRERLAAAVVANTPAADEPAPEPAPEPTPEPTPEPAPPDEPTPEPAPVDEPTPEPIPEPAPDDGSLPQARRSR